jgi:CRP-like cAMP-binding protein
VDFLADLGRLALFADLPASELEAIALRCDERSFASGEWIVRQGDPRSDVYLIVDGEVVVVIDDEDRRLLSKGSFFGEVSVLLGEAATASILTRTPLRCLVVPGAKAEARRLATASEWPT